MATYKDFKENSTKFYMDIPATNSRLERSLRLVDTVTRCNLEGYSEVIKNNVKEKNETRYVSGLEEIIDKDPVLKEGFVKVTFILMLIRTIQVRNLIMTFPSMF